MRTCFVEFFATDIRNVHTRRAYTLGINEFLVWCKRNGVAALKDIQPVHVAGYIEWLGTRGKPGSLAKTTIKQRLSAIRRLFDWLVTGRVVTANPAVSVRGPRHIVTQGKTPILSPDQARRLLDSIELSNHAGLRDRALIGLMVYSFARIGAALAMKVEDVFVQNRRLCVRLYQRDGRPIKSCATEIWRAICAPTLRAAVFQGRARRRCFARSEKPPASSPLLLYLSPTLMP